MKIIREQHKNLEAKGRTYECIVRGMHEEKPFFVKLIAANQLKSCEGNYK